MRLITWKKTDIMNPPKQTAKRQGRCTAVKGNQKKRNTARLNCGHISVCKQQRGKAAAQRSNETATTESGPLLR